MSIEKRVQLLLEVWVRLDEIKNLTSAIVKGLDYEIDMEREEVRSVLHIINRLTEEIINDIRNNMA